MRTSGMSTDNPGPDSLTSVGSSSGFGPGSPAGAEMRMVGAGGNSDGKHSASLRSSEEEHPIGDATGDGGKAKAILVTTFHLNSKFGGKICDEQ